MRHEKIFKSVFCAILAALIVVMVITGIGYIPIGTIAYITILTIPVFVGSIFLGKWYGLILGTVFGLTSMIYSFIIPAGNAPFTNPLLSVLPRAFLGFIVAIIYDSFKKMFKKDNLSIVAAIIAVLCGQIIHSFSVLAILYFVAKTNFYFMADAYSFVVEGNLLPFIIGAFGVNGVIETIAAVIIVPPITFALQKATRNRYDNKLSDKELDEDYEQL